MAPPSTRSSVSAMPESAAIASISSALWNAIASSVARARCARVVPRVMPDDGAARVRIPVGRAQPRERGHEEDAAGVGHARGERLDVGGACAMMPRPSRSHWIAAPAMKTLPSSA